MVSGVSQQICGGGTGVTGQGTLTPDRSYFDEYHHIDIVGPR